MYEYNVPDELHTELTTHPSRLMSLAIGMLGDYAANICDIPISVRLDRQDQSSDLNFPAYYFDAYYQARLGTTIQPYIKLLGSASYYLSNLPGGALVLIKDIESNGFDLDASGFEHLIFSILRGDADIITVNASRFETELTELNGNLSVYRKTGLDSEPLFISINNLRNQVYRQGSARELLFVDVAGALIRVMYENSCWRCLPEYSNLPVSIWENTIKRASFIKELWPAQRLLGKQGVFEGRSAVIQMPTSAGKTRATEIIIRSAFLAKRTDIAVIVAPFKALCHEISDNLNKAFAEETISVEEFSDVIQDDIASFVSSVKQQIFVVTPEKLVYVLKQAPEFAIGVGLLIYDEGHQFDTGSRGVTFELLLTALKSIVSQAQTVLISAVLSNANAISEWLNPNGAELVSGLGLAPNFRSIAFSSWTGDVGQLHFVNEKRPSIEEYLVPRVIEPINLGRKKRAKSDTLFPEKANLNTVSLFLGLKLAANGSVALFCGTKITASALCKKAVEMYGRSLPMSSPAEHSNQEEIRKLTLLHEKNLGANENMTLASNYGIFSHHNNVPYGIRLSIEHSMREGMIKFVLCTSTLSQGVNLPIRYLIVSGIQQGSEGMKTRDFHNLIGRAGRSGIHTEGSVIFGNPDVYDGRKNRETNWRWSQAINLLSPDSNEPCKSHLLTILDNFFNINTKQNIPDFDALEFCEQYINGVPLTVTIPERIASTQAELLIIRSSIQEQVKSKLQILASIESYLMSYAVEGTLDTQSDVSQLASSTLAYHLAREDDKPKLIKLFELLESNIKSTAPTYVRRRVFGKTLFGLQKSVEIEQWVDENTASLNSSLTIVELLNLTWPIVESSINAKIFNNLNRKEEIKAFALLWIQGYPYHILLARLRDAGVEYKHGATTRKLTIEQVIDLCQNALAYEGSLVIGAICSILGYLTSDQNPTVSLLKALQKNIQYGLPNKAATIFYELGFSDRVLAQELSMIAGSIQSRNEAIDGMILASEEYKQAIITYPSYFGYTLLDCLNKDVLS